LLFSLSNILLVHYNISQQTLNNWRFLSFGSFFFFTHGTKNNKINSFESIHEDDLLGLHAIKTHFWERDQPDVTVYLRRVTVDNTYVWLSARVVSYIDSPVPGIIIHERFIHEERDDGYGDNSDNSYDMDNIELGVARMVSRVTRIAALLLQAVESALFGGNDRTRHGSIGNEGDLRNINSAGSGESPSNGDNVDGGGAAEIQAMLLEAAEKMGVDLSSSDNPLRELIQAGGMGGSGNSYDGVAGGGPGGGGNGNLASGGGASGTNIGSGEDERSRKKNADPLDYLKTGAVLDLSKIILSEGEVKLITLVLTGRLQIEDLGPLLYLALNSLGMDLVAATDEFYQLSEQQLIANANAQSPSEVVLHNPPPLAVINLSYTDIGDYGMEALSEFLYSDNAALKTVDLSFCSIDTQGFLSLCHGLRTRNSRGLPPIEALVLAGNTIHDDVGKQLGLAISSTRTKHYKRKSGEHEAIHMAYSNSSSDGIKLLHLGSTSISMKCLKELLSGLGPTCPLQELKLQSNRIGPLDAAILVKFLEEKSDNGLPVLPKLNRLDMSYNELGDIGTTKLTRAISKRSKVHMTEVSLSGNDMGPKGIESIMNKLLQHKLITLNLDNNSIGDQGCQLVAASLRSIPTLHRLNLAFNDIGCRGIATLMRSLVGCESITSLGLSGNVMRVSGAIAMGFTLAQHPRLSVLELDNCCLSQVAQCHIAAGIISNRWVPMKVMHGFRAGPPMVAIGALEIMAQHFTNEECFRIRRDIQMKTLLQWMESNRNASSSDRRTLTNDLLSGANDSTGAPSQSAYLRMLDWLGRIPFDESELMDLRKYFYDISGGEGDHKSGSNLKHRGDILSALASDVVEEILESEPLACSYDDKSVGLDLSVTDDTNIKAGEPSTRAPEVRMPLSADCMPKTPEEMGEMYGASIEVRGRSDTSSLRMDDFTNGFGNRSSSKAMHRNSVSSLSMNTGRSGSISSHSRSQESSRSDNIQYKARITMFPEFAAKLDNLKAVAQEMMDNELDPVQQDIIAQQFAEASLTILRQLRYHCMESGLDGWRQGKLRRKVLIVDDSIVTRKMVARAFEKANFIVDTAENGVEGVNKMKESIYDIAFMDIDMPVMNGFDATKALRMWEDSVRPGARQPICALTAAHVDDFDREELMKFKDAGLDVMESKPCNIPRLFKVVDDVSPMFSDLSINAIQQSDEGHFDMVTA
jgi:CheY-like chemotaxis protein